MVDQSKNGKVSWINQKLFKVTWRRFKTYLESGNGIEVGKRGDKCFTNDEFNGTLRINLESCPELRYTPLTFVCQTEYIGHRMQSIWEVRKNQFASRKGGLPFESKVFKDSE